MILVRSRRPVPALPVAALLTLLLALPAVAGAAEVSTAPPIEAQILDVEHVNVSELALALRIFGVDTQPHPRLEAISLRGEPAAMATALAAARRLDVPAAPTAQSPVAASDLDLRIHVLTIGDGPAHPLPAELAPLAGQLADILGDARVEQVDTLVLRLRDGAQGALQGALGSPDGSQWTPYELHLGRTVIRPDGRPEAVRLDSFRFEASLPWREPGATVHEAALSSEARPATVALAAAEPPTRGGLRTTTALRTDLELPYGVPVLLGKAPADGAQRGLVLALTARAAD